MGMGTTHKAGSHSAGSTRETMADRGGLVLHGVPCLLLASYCSRTVDREHRAMDAPRNFHVSRSTVRVVRVVRQSHPVLCYYVYAQAARRTPEYTHTHPSTRTRTRTRTRIRTRTHTRTLCGVDVAFYRALYRNGAPRSTATASSSLDDAVAVLELLELELDTTLESDAPTDGSGHSSTVPVCFWFGICHWPAVDTLICMAARLEGLLYYKLAKTSNCSGQRAIVAHVDH